MKKINDMAKMEREGLSGKMARGRERGREEEGRDYRSEEAGAYEAEAGKGKVRAKYWRKIFFF